jgi:serine protease AprX
LKTLLILFLSISFAVQAQSYQFEVKFKFKDTSKYNTSLPSDFLTTKALARKVKNKAVVGIDDFPITSNYLDSLSKYFSVKSISKWFNLSTVQTNDSLSIDSLKNFSFVGSYKYIGKSRFSLARVSKKVELAATDEIDYGSASVAINQVKGEELHNNNYLGEGITIAVLDAGFTNANNMDIFAPLLNEERIVAQKNFISPADDVYRSNQHGTQVLSVLAGNKDGEYIGSAPNAYYMLLLTEDVSEENLIEEYFWTQAAEYADSMGADILTSSLGYNTFDTQAMDHLPADIGNSTTMVSQAAKKAVQKGMLVLNSAGNEGNQPWKNLLFPADEELVLTVGGVNSEGQYVNFSSSAPLDLPFVKPNVVAFAEGVSVANSDGTYSNANGTSFSCPIIAGLAACLWQALPEKNHYEIKELIEQSSHQYDQPDRQMGYGIPNFSQAIEQLVLNGELSQSPTLFPNPTNQSQISLKHSIQIKIISVRLFDVAGKELNVLSFKTNNANCTDILLSILSQGTYFLTFSTESGLFQKQLIVN